MHYINYVSTSTTLFHFYCIFYASFLWLCDLWCFYFIIDIVLPSSFCSNVYILYFNIYCQCVHLATCVTQMLQQTHATNHNKFFRAWLFLVVYSAHVLNVLVQLKIFRIFSEKWFNTWYGIKYAVFFAGNCWSESRNLL